MYNQIDFWIIFSVNSMIVFLKNGCAELTVLVIKNNSFDCGCKDRVNKLNCSIWFNEQTILFKWAPDQAYKTNILISENHPFQEMKKGQLSQRFGNFRKLPFILRKLRCYKVFSPKTTHENYSKTAVFENWYFGPKITVFN